MQRKQAWDLRYSNPEFIYGLEPNSYLAQELSLLAPGKLLLPGEGEGRNALWAALNGWEVTSFDYSEVAQKKAQLLFNKHKASINYLLTNVLDFTPTHLFDAVGIIFVH